MSCHKVCALCRICPVLLVRLLLLTLKKIFSETECCKWLDVLQKQLIPYVLTAYLSKTPLPNDIYWNIFGSDSTI